jgi:hypothetical protein
VGRSRLPGCPVLSKSGLFRQLVVTEERAAQFAGFDTRDQLVVEIDLTWLDALNPFAGQPPAPVERWAGSGDERASAAEGDNDLQTVLAVGATKSIRRRYLGLQSGIHTLLGCLLAVPLTLLLMRSGAYTQVGGFGVFDSTRLFVPWVGIAMLVVGLPLIIGMVTSVAVRSAKTIPPRRAT